MVGSGMLYNQSKYSLAWPWNFGNSSSKTRVFLLSDHVSSGSDLNAPLGQLLEPISSSETRDVKLELERKSSNLGISATYVPPPHCRYLCDITPTATTYVTPPHCHYLCATTSLSLPMWHHLTVKNSVPQPMRQEPIQTKYKYTRHILRFCKG